MSSIARPIQGIERPFHVTLVGMGVLDQCNGGDDESEDLAEKSGSHKKFQSLPRKNAMEICARARKCLCFRRSLLRVKKLLNRRCASV